MKNSKMTDKPSAEKRPPADTWSQACQRLEHNGQAYCLATIITRQGSIPGQLGSKMVITPESQYDTLGGGNLEFKVIKRARQTLTSGHTPTCGGNNILSERFSLSQKEGQVCGGALEVLFEYRNLNRPQVVIFGAGHVCQALCRILAELPCRATVIDTRQQWLDSIDSNNITLRCCSQPEAEIAALPPDAYILVMTYDHQLDFQLVRLTLERKNFAYVGLIGSAHKRKQAERYLKRHQIDPALINQLICPIGLAEVRGNIPMQIAVSVAAELIGRFATDKKSDQL